MDDPITTKKKEYKKVFYINTSPSRLNFKDFNSSSLLIIANSTAYLLRDPIKRPSLLRTP
jgi:hypothetical protein